ncbi:hypothetical protein [Candidatus Pantoea multigeneris]|uniref:Uncharacterized protein n=1 Tax=Candidatus Pantoea multigeneris TaxID=2608357 RepID=A0ABX0RCI2_9GAMM|nr:hypothetical protein [Pantoea multigeneris]NIF22097.1 hypothetical protein [Pantoea multigeneris]
MERGAPAGESHGDAGPPGDAADGGAVPLRRAGTPDRAREYTRIYWYHTRPDGTPKQLSNMTSPTPQSARNDQKKQGE